MVENRMVVDSQWSAMEKEEIEPGYFDRWGTFVKKEYLLEVAMEDIQKDSVARGSFLELICDYIENNEEIKEKFLKWYYPDYGKE